MREVLDRKRSKIAYIWNNYILEYKFCNSKIKFTEDVKSNYFGDILNYFSDTFDIIYGAKKTEVFSENIENSISFLQAIYIQQDFIEELLHIFKSDIDKGILKKDPNYSINRELRNELVGHPIRKTDINGTRQLLSSTLFSNSINDKQISYLRYHKNRNYKFEEVKHLKSDIIKRHSCFIETYFDIIIQKLKGILRSFKIKLEEIEKVAQNKPFENVVTIVTHSFEYIFKTNYLYNPEILERVYRLKDQNQRYLNAIEMFYNDLNQSLKDRKDDIIELINDNNNRNSIIRNYDESKMPEIIYIETNKDYASTIEKNEEKNYPKTFYYEMSKLVSRDDNFNFCTSLLKSKFNHNKLVMSEIENMKLNFSEKLEYYCSYHLIDKLLREETNASH
jgi:hypothetical protein